MAEAETLGRGAVQELAPAPAKLPPSRLPRNRRTLFAKPPNWVHRLMEPASTRRLFILLPFAMVAGLVAYVVLPVEPLPWALATVAAVLALAAAWARHSPHLSLWAILLAVWFGLCLLPLHGHWFGTEMLARPSYGLFEAQVDEIISATAEEQRVVVSNLRRLEDRPPVPIRRARLLLPGEPALAPGDHIEVKLRLAPVPGPVLPGAYDGQFHNYFAGIGAYGSALGSVFLLQSGTGSVTRSVEALRSAIGVRIDTVLDGPSAAIGRAMVMGDQSLITDELRDVMAASGLAHIYSISGLHLSLVAGGVYWLLRLLLASIPAFGSRWPVKRIAALVGILAAAAYLMLAGGPANIPALRSTIMLALIFGAVLAGRQALTMRNVAVAALIIIVLDPASVFRPSFQLSFAAVVGLIGVYELPRPARPRDRNWFGRLWFAVWTAALTSLVAGIATLLFSAYHFQQTAPLGVLGNVLVLPVVSIVIMPFAILSVLAMPLGIEAPFVRVMGWGIDRMVDGAHLVAGWSEGLTGNPLLTGSALLVGVAALAWFAVLRSHWRFVGPALALPIILLTGLDHRPDILVADTTQAVALRSDEGLGLVSGRTGSFAVDVWSRHYQEPIAATASGTHCDSMGCIARTDRFSIAVVRSADAFPEDCGRHSLLIARIDAPAWCRVGQIIDAQDLAAGGVHWLRWNEATRSFDIRTAIPNLSRPWRIAPR